MTLKVSMGCKTINNFVCLILVDFLCQCFCLLSSFGIIQSVKLNVLILLGKELKQPC